MAGKTKKSSVRKVKSTGKKAQKPAPKTPARSALKKPGKPARIKTVEAKPPVLKKRLKTQVKTAKPKILSGKAPVRTTAAKIVRKIFLTGFPGFIGKRIALQILKSEPDAEFVFLVQKKFEKAAADAVAGIRAAVGGHPKLSIVFGDITLEDLGLTTGDMKRIVGSVNEVWNLAAIYDLAIAEQIAYRVNVEGTANVLSFCEKLTGLKRFVHVSTCYVSGRRTGKVLEEELELGQSFKNHYESTKFKSEVLVRERMGKIPTIIIRPSIVVGDSETGEADKYDGPYPVIRLLAWMENKKALPGGLRLPSLGGGKGNPNFVPLDYLVAAACHIAVQPESIGKTFQICDPSPLTTKELLTYIYGQFGLGLPIGWVPVPVMEMMMRLPGLSDVIKLQKESLIYMDHQVDYDCSNTLTALQGSGLNCPDFRDYLPRLVHYVRGNLRGKRKAMY